MTVYEQSAEQRAILLEKQQRRATLRAEYLKQMSNPHTLAKGEGGHLFDPQFQRFQAMRVSHYEHFKPTGVALRGGLLYLAIPIIGFTAWVKYDRDRREQEYRTGQVAYKDRKFKFI